MDQGQPRLFKLHSISAKSSVSSGHRSLSIFKEHSATITSTTRFCIQSYKLLLYFNHLSLDMASLSEVIRTVKSIVDNATELMVDLDWPISGLRSCFELCSGTKLVKWHLEVQGTYGSKVHDRKFREVQGRIDKCLKSASRKTHALRLWTERGEIPDPRIVSYRHLVILALRKVLQALECFCELKGNQRGIVFEYLKKCYGFMIGLGQLLYPYKDGDSWFTECGSFLDLDLPDFRLDGKVFRQVPANPTLPGQIMDGSQIPMTHLPSWPEPALAVRTRGPYGPALSRNLYRKLQVADERVPFIQEAPNYQLFENSYQYPFSSYENVKSRFIEQPNTYSPLPEYTSSFQIFQEPTPPSSNESSFRQL
ncbi:hypothetical protein VTL71DRAFT_3080 [Oculimacula yallundae]|uniref:Uncharacterized protein n=1 Tax=Oculimacula yallundae TaxID=86028 RepID=A0ABR4C6U5_9HELO